MVGHGQSFCFPCWLAGSMGSTFCVVLPLVRFPNPDCPPGRGPCTRAPRRFFGFAISFIGDLLQSASRSARLADQLRLKLEDTEAWMKASRAGCVGRAAWGGVG